MAHSSPEQSTPDWEALAAQPAFKALLKDKLAFIVPSCWFFIAYYFLLPILAGWYPEVMSKKVLGPVSFGYLFALSQFVMSWALAWIYVRRARKWDIQAAEVIKGQS